MQLDGPYRYKLSVAEGTLMSVSSPDGVDHFTKPVTQTGPKLYVVTQGLDPVYVGVTKQPIRARLRSGFTADGGHGYYGYAWAKVPGDFGLDIWIQADPPAVEPLRGVETVEAEVVFLIRSAARSWPRYQTEIHFYESTAEHRDWADRILAAFTKSA